MHKTLTLISAGVVGFMLAGCEQQQDNFGPADGLPQNEPPRTEPDVQIGQGERFEEPEPVSPAIEREIEPEVIRPDDTGSLEPQQEPVNPDLQN